MKTSILLLCASLCYGQAEIGLSVGANVETMPDCGYYTTGALVASMSLGYVTDKVEVSLGLGASVDLGVDHSLYFGGWYLAGEYYDEYGDYNYEWAHDDAWLEYAIGFHIPVTIALPEHGLSVEFSWSRDKLMLGDSFGLSITRDWLWGF